jgi:histidinol-phosphatase
MNPDFRNRYEVAIETAKSAGQHALRYFDGPLTVERKGDQSPVTVADRETEQLLRTSLSKHFPKDGFVGEEYGDTPGTSGYRWILDPIDGTRSFVRGIPLWGVLVGLEYKGELIAGVADAAPLGHTYHALRGNGAFRNDLPIQVSDEASIANSLLLYSSLSWFLKAGREADFIRLVNATERQRGYGDFYGFMLVAQGAAEIMVEHGVHIWDVAAIVPIVEEAGGRFSDWDGAADCNRPDVLVTNGKLHDVALAFLNGTKAGLL